MNELDRSDSEQERRPAPGFPSDRTVRIAVCGTFTILAIGIFYFAEGFLLPVTLAFLMALILSPVVRALRKSGVPEGVSAVLLVSLLTLAIAGATYTLSGPVSSIIDDAPQIGYELRRKLHVLREPLKKVEEAKERVDAVTRGEAAPGVQEVVVREPGLLTWAASGVPEIAAGGGLALVLLIFLLASGDLFYEKLVRSMPTMRDKKRWLRIVYDVEREVSRYLFTVSAINAGLGLCIALGLWVVGMPNPLLWGIMAGVLNFVPYLGALVGIVVVAIIALVEFPTLGAALAAPAVYAVCNTLEGQFITPALVGRRLQVNSVSVFLAIAFWGWIWGVIGALIAVPMLIVVKVFAHHADGLQGLEEFLSVRAARPTGDDDAGESETAAS